MSSRLLKVASFIFPPQTPKLDLNFRLFKTSGISYILHICDQMYAILSCLGSFPYLLLTIKEYYNNNTCVETQIYKQS